MIKKNRLHFTTSCNRKKDFLLSVTDEPRLYPVEMRCNLLGLVLPSLVRVTDSVDCTESTSNWEIKRKLTGAMRGVVNPLR